MTVADRYWVGQELFVSKGQMTAKLKTWCYPPTVDHLLVNLRSPDSYFSKRLFLWIPRKMWAMRLVCPHCKQALRSKGAYRKVQLVVDLKDWYYLVGEYMYCSTTRCTRTYISWDSRILKQLPDSVQARFPVVLTYKYACDRAVIALLRARTLGNSPSALQRNILEVHSQEWLKKQLMYLGDCCRHRKGRQDLGLQVPEYAEPPRFPQFPTAQWFLAVYVKDVWARLPSLLASLTSTYGCILKIDSTKKNCKKMQDAAAGTANWATSVGNERGEVVITIMTTSESIPSLQKLAVRLMNRYKNGGVRCYTSTEIVAARGVSRSTSSFSLAGKGCWYG